MEHQCCPVNLNLVLLQLATHLVYRVFSGIGDINVGNLFPSFRRRPRSGAGMHRTRSEGCKSSDFNDFLDTGLRRYDD